VNTGDARSDENVRYVGRHPSIMTEAIVVGIDGAGFQLLKPWLDDGTLPNLARLMDSGMVAALQTTYPPVTCPAWRCYSTGVNPGKHGVFWWENVDREAGTFSIPTGKDFDAPSVWDYLGEDGLTSGIINMPTTFPPEDINGWMVSGGGGVEGKEFTHPPELKFELEDRFDYQVFASGTSSNLAENHKRVQEVLDIIDIRFDAADYVKDKYDPDFLSLTVFYSNVFHHFFWDDDVTRRVWKHIDQRLGEFIGDEDNVFIISDHGSNPIHWEFNINTWLEQEGYLVTTGSISDHFYRFGLTRSRITGLVDRMGMKNTLKRILPRSTASRLPAEDGTVSGHSKAGKIDWDASTAMASGQGPVYVLADNLRERESLRDELIQELAAVETPDGRPVASEVFAAEDVYNGPYVTVGPDLIIDQGNNIQVAGRVGGDEVFDEPTNWVAENHRDGVLVAHGPEVATDSEFEQQPVIYDVAPTILHWFDQAVPELIDGRVLTELFDDDSEPARRSVETADRGNVGSARRSGEDDQGQMRERLQDLGYLSE
jgi:predicted AlkP superfamily phosphohydrolase/phosphomutase